MKAKIVWFSAAVVASASSVAADGFSVSTGADYSSGKYGDTISTEVLAIPLTARYDAGAFTWKLSVPYLEITGPGNVIGAGSDGSAIVVDSGAGTRGRVTGLGDVTGSVTYNAYFNNEAGVVLDLGGKVKFATADSSKRLGTGKSDQSLQVDLYKMMGRLTLMATLGYKWMGKPVGSGFRNVAYGSGGAVWQLSDPVSVGAIVDWRQSVVATRSDQIELTLFAQRALDKHWKLLAYVYSGSNSSSPDLGGGVSVSYRY